MSLNFELALSLRGLVLLQGPQLNERKLPYVSDPRLFCDESAEILNLERSLREIVGSAFPELEVKIVPSEPLELFINWGRFAALIQSIVEISSDELAARRIDVAITDDEKFIRIEFSCPFESPIPPAVYCPHVLKRLLIFYDSPPLEITLKNGIRVVTLRLARPDKIEY